jgi:hypothetical protein
MNENTDLAATRAELIKVMADLRAAIAACVSVDAVNALLIEIDEVNHRITLLGQLIFHAQTDEIAAAARDVAAGTAQVRQAIAQIDQLNRFITTISHFLGLVDQVIDLAKRV